MAIRDISEGSRIEVAGIRTLADAAAAIEHLLSYPTLRDQAPTLHTYLSGDSFIFWTEGTHDDLG